MITDSQVDDNIPIPVQRRRTSVLVAKLFNLNVGQSFLCEHYASGSISLIKKTNPERNYTRRRDPVSGKIRIWRDKDILQDQQLIK